VCCAIAIVSSSKTEDEYKEEFQKYVISFHRTYDGEEKQIRFENFKKNLDFVETHNSNPTRTFDVGMNKFADWSRKEYLDYVGPLSSHEFTPSDNFNGISDEQKQALPVSWDWVSKGAVTPIEDQLQCGSSPYFSAVTSMEACHFFGTGKLIVLSVQNMVDCPRDTENQGCNGGEMYATFQVIQGEKGIDTNSCYPYVGEEGEACKFNPDPPCCGSTIGSYVNVTPTEDAVQLGILKVPVASAMDASLSSFQLYTSGVYSDPQCSSQEVDHGIAIVGYGVDSSSGLDYWILKNTWGKDWGMEGYMWIARNDGNMCGIASYPSYALGCGDCS